MYGEATDLLMDGGRVCGLVMADGSEMRTGAVILTTGTFLRGVIHIGDVSRPGGRTGDKPSVKLAERIEETQGLKPPSKRARRKCVAPAPAAQQ